MHDRTEKDGERCLPDSHIALIDKKKKEFKKALF
jgi:hypothetical protein